MKRVGLFLLAVVISAGCVNHMVTSTLKSPGWVSKRGAPSTPKILTAAPSEEYTVVGTLQIRAVRLVPADTLLAKMSDMAANLDADAVIPPGPDVPRELKLPSMDPYRAYYLFDDNQSLVVEGRAIRYKK